MVTLGVVEVLKLRKIIAVIGLPFAFLISLIVTISAISYHQVPVKVISVHETGLYIHPDWRCVEHDGKYAVVGKVVNSWNEPVDYVLVTVDLWKANGDYWRTNKQSLGQFLPHQTKVFYITQDIRKDILISRCEIKLFDEKGNLLIEGDD